MTNISKAQTVIETDLQRVSDLHVRMSLEHHPSPLLQLSSTIAVTHHEKWDGTGYPYGLAEEKISLEGRIVAIADVFDALTSERPYKKAWAVEDAARMIDDSSGSQFDPSPKVLINLFMNSAHAMERDGNLSVTSCLKTIDSKEVLDFDHEYNFSMGERVLWFEVTDTGPGIREKDRHKIFEPFYTTKPVGEGTGLGLSVSRNIMNLHHGSIDIRNQAEGGALVVLIFKLTTGEEK